MCTRHVQDLPGLGKLLRADLIMLAFSTSMSQEVLPLYGSVPSEVQQEVSEPALVVFPFSPDIDDPLVQKIHSLGIWSDRGRYA